MKKFITGLLIFCALLLAVLCSLDGLYTWLIVPKVCNKEAWIFNKQNGIYDFAVLGDSRVLYVVNVAAIEKHTGLKGINLGTSGSKPVENALVLSRFLQTNRVKTLLLQLDATIFLEVVSPVNDKLPFFETYSFMPYIHDDDVYNTITPYTSCIKYLPWRYIPFVRYAEFNNVYSVDKLWSESNCEFDETGYASVSRQMAPSSAPGITKARTDSLTAKNDSNAAINITAVTNIIRQCNQHHIKLVLFTSPVNKLEFQNPSTNYCISYLSRFSTNQGLQYWDLSRQFVNSPDSLFADSFHTNCFADDSLARVLAAHLLQP